MDVYITFQKLSTGLENVFINSRLRCRDDNMLACYHTNDWN